MSDYVGARNGGPVMAIEHINSHLRRIGSKSPARTRHTSGAALVFILAEPALNSEMMGQRGRRYAVGHLTWAATVAELQAAYSCATQIH